MNKEFQRTIVCYGDSNTWGSIPQLDERYPKSIRWPGALQGLLGENYDIISEGLPGRTFVISNPIKPHRTGITHLQAILESAEPVDLIIVMLGTNDVKNTYNLTTEQISDHLLQTVRLIRKVSSTTKILIICPPPIIIPETSDLDERMVRGIELFKVLPMLYKKISDDNGCGFINAGDHISSSKIDGYHLDADAHLKIAQIVKDWINQNL